MVTDSTVGMATGMAATVRTKAELPTRRSSNGIAAEQGNGQDQHHQDHRDDDQEVADLQHGALKMADRVGRFDQLGRLAEIGLPGRCA